MEKQIEIVGFGMIRCLHCGELVKLSGDIHFCDVPKEEWLNKQDKAFIQLPDGSLFDMKKKEIIS